MSPVCAGVNFHCINSRWQIIHVKWHIPADGSKLCTIYCSYKILLGFCCTHFTYFSSVFSLGDYLKWGQQIHIRHMTTKNYLALDKDGIVYLSQNCRNPNAVFRLHSVTRVWVLFLGLLHFCNLCFHLKHPVGTLVYTWLHSQWV